MCRTSKIEIRWCLFDNAIWTFPWSRIGYVVGEKKKSTRNKTSFWILILMLLPSARHRAVLHTGWKIARCLRLDKPAIACISGSWRWMWFVGLPILRLSALSSCRFCMITVFCSDFLWIRQILLSVVHDFQSMKWAIGRKLVEHKEEIMWFL